MEETNLTDVWRQANPDVSKFTWRRKNPYPIHSRLDFFLVSFGLVGYVRKTDIIPGYRTDHSAITLQLNLNYQPRGPGFWKLNCSLLKELEYINLIKDTIKEVTDEFTEDAIMKWEMIKMKVRMKTMQFSAQRKRNKKKRVEELETQLKILEEEYSETQDENIEKQIREIKTNLETEMEQDTKGAMIRSKVRWYDEGEKPTKYFFNLEKRNYNNKIISKIKVKDDIIIEPKQILQEEKKFYSNLYTSVRTGPNADTDELVMNFFAENDTIPKLSQHQRDSCEGELTEAELLATLKSTSNNKSPGSDGFPAEFYKVFWIDCKQYLLEALNLAYRIGLLSVTQRHSIITLLPKREKDLTELKNWRPISLLNQDYKLAAKSISLRMKKSFIKPYTRRSNWFFKR